MLIMENSEEVLQILERYCKLKPKDIPKELEDYLCYVARTGDTVYRWAHVKLLFREKLLYVIKDFHETTPSVEDLPQYPNVDPFNYENMKTALLERLELFTAAPFTVQRLCELLTDPKKQYNRIDKYMRALEKNILVVSTIEPGRKLAESENGDSLDSVVNGDLSLDVNVEVDMENESLFGIEPGNTSANSSLDKPENMPQVMRTDPEKNELENSDDEKQELNVGTKESVVLSPTDNSKTENLDIESDQNINENTVKTDTDQLAQINDEKLDEALADEPETVNPPNDEKNENLEADESDSTLTAQITTENSKNIIKEDKVVSDSEDKPAKSDSDWETSAILGAPDSSSTQENILDVQEKQEQNNVDSAVNVNETTVVDNVQPQSENIETEISCKIQKEDNVEKIILESKVDDDDINFKKAQEHMTIEEGYAMPSVEEVNAPQIEPIPDILPQQAISDQPMDENVDNALQTPVSSCLNEILMQSETEMATDQDNTKSDASVMDIDDISQEEAMDH